MSAPTLHPEHEDATLSEMLWAFLPALRRRFGTPEPWQPRRLLLGPQARAAQSLSFRLREHGGTLLRTFRVPEVAPGDEGGPPRRPRPPCRWL